MAEELNCTGGPELCRSEPVETRLQIQVIFISISRLKNFFREIDFQFVILYFNFKNNENKFRENVFNF